MDEQEPDDEELVKSIAEAVYGLYATPATPGYPKPMTPALAPSVRLVGGEIRLTVYTDPYGPVVFPLTFSQALLTLSELAHVVCGRNAESERARFLDDGAGDPDEVPDRAPET